ncbi:MAG: 50S ribosome-binding GTPase, partial [Patescibacteria group bacterium]|nr:50S ribosome-binding GTPase [Patescibacteria group bacterium]
GTTITDTQTEEEIEISDEGKPVLLAKGGQGGRGNNEFKTATNQAPTFAEQGQSGEAKTLHLVMQLIADIGFIGLPNAGKSSLLTALTNARPKIGAYPFTTLEPNLGVLQTKGKHIVLADIPGLIEGASLGKGLGTKFLKHIEKTACLVHCIDSTNENIGKTYEIVRKELDAFSKTLVQKKEIILLTKTDLLSVGELNQKIGEAKQLGNDIYTVSVYNSEKLGELSLILQRLID